MTYVYTALHFVLLMVLDTKRDYYITAFSGWLVFVIEPAVSKGV